MTRASLSWGGSPRRPKTPRTKRAPTRPGDRSAQHSTMAGAPDAMPNALACRDQGSPSRRVADVPSGGMRAGSMSRAAWARRRQQCVCDCSGRRQHRRRRRQAWPPRRWSCQGRVAGAAMVANRSRLAPVGATGRGRHSGVRRCRRGVRPPWESDCRCGIPHARSSHSSRPGRLATATASLPKKGDRLLDARGHRAPHLVLRNSLTLKWGSLSPRGVLAVMSRSENRDVCR